mmetsp:Transcript_89699/g.231538  ORF Transcript_89699/g.231538 Transcript_89699/m.231538 type:complete len:239 (+) Transcript_89699:42-758(+)
MLPQDGRRTPAGGSSPGSSTAGPASSLGVHKSCRGVRPSISSTRSASLGRAPSSSLRGDAMLFLRAVPAGLVGALPRREEAHSLPLSQGSSDSSMSVSSRACSVKKLALPPPRQALTPSMFSALSAKRCIRSSAASTCRSRLSSASSSQSRSTCSDSLLERCSASLPFICAMRRPSSSHVMESATHRSCRLMLPSDPPVQASPCGVSAEVLLLGTGCVSSPLAASPGPWHGTASGASP